MPLIGSHGPKTVKGSIGFIWVTILIDTGSTYNLLDPAIVNGMPYPKRCEGENTKNFVYFGCLCIGTSMVRYGIGNSVAQKAWFNLLEL